jgi:hypothetical protein
VGVDLFDRITVDDAGCWLWNAALNHAGYGIVSISGYRQMQLVHRVMYRQARGPIPLGLELDHLCRVRRCCNPAHLEAVTHAENVRRGQAGVVVAETNRRRGADVTHCPNGHEYTDANTYVYANKRGWQMRHCRTCDKLKKQARRAVAKGH